MSEVEKKFNQYILRYETKNEMIMFASIMMAVLLATSLLPLNPSIARNAEAFIELNEVFCLKYPEFCEEEIIPSGGVTTCPAGTTLEGHVVLEATAPLVCEIGIPQLLVCPPNTNLAGAIVTDLQLCDLD